jgi:hypothetical protein
MVLPLGKGKTYWFVKLRWSSAESGKCAQGAKALRNAENVFTIAGFRGAIALENKSAVLPDEQSPLAALRGIGSGCLKISKGPST